MNKYFSYLSPRYYSSFLYQTIFIAITTLITVYMLYLWTFAFFPLEKVLEVTPITPQILAQWHAEPIRVKTGMTITHILKFDMVKNNFEIAAIVWFMFDPKKISPEVIDQFSFIKGTVTQKTVNYVTIDEHTTRAEYYITLKFYETLNYSRFPLDDHYLNLRLTNEKFDPRKIIFESADANFIYMKNIYLPGWWISNLMVKPGFREWPLQISATKTYKREQAVVNFGIGMPISSMRHVLLIVIPLLFLFYIGLISFAVTRFQEVLTLSAASIAGFIAYSYVIQSLSPEVAPFLVSDYLLFFFFSMGFLIFLLNAIFYQQRHKVQENTLLFVKGITVLVMHISFLLLFYYFLFHHLTTGLDVTGISNIVTV